MNQEVTLQDILQIEDCKEILEFSCPDTGIPLWSTMRVPFLRLVMRDLLFAAPLVDSYSGRGFFSTLRLGAMASRALAHNIFGFKATQVQHPIVVMATGVRLIQMDGHYFNTLSDYFVASAPDITCVIEEMFQSKWPFPRHHNTVLLHTPIRIEGALKGRLRATGYRDAASKIVDLVSRRAKSKIGWNLDEERRKWLVTLCANGAASLFPRYRRYLAIFKKMGARLLIKEEACYGGADNAAAILAARHLGMQTAEYQHGSVSAGHDAYNYSSIILNSPEYIKTLPEYFLTYGAWWGDQINAPVKKVTIGNPHRAETLSNASSDPVHGRNILVLGDGIETNLYVDLCVSLAAALGDTFEVVFRPHPLERANTRAIHPNGFIGKVRIDSHQDIYGAFQSAGTVVSEVSTGLFDAIGLVPKVFIWNTHKARFTYPAHPFRSFNAANDLADLIRDDNAGHVSTRQIESIWTPHWERNYLEFIEKAIRR